MEAVAELYQVPQEHLDFQATIRQIAQERVAPRAAEIDELAEYPQDIRELFAEHDLLGLPFETEHGGTGTGTLMLNMAVEEISKVCASSALILMIVGIVGLVFSLLWMLVYADRGRGHTVVRERPRERDPYDR